MKVGLLVPGGVDRSGEYRVIPCLLWLIERLARKHDVHVFALWQEPGPSRYQLLGAEVHNIGASPRRPRMLAQIVAEHRRRPFDVLHAMWAAPPGVVGALASKILRVPLLLHITGGDLADLPAINYGGRRHWRGRLWLRAAVAGASFITTPSREMQRTASRLDIEAERLPFGVALDRWRPLAPRRRDTSESARLIHVASLNPVKDQTTLLRAVRDMQEQGCRFHLDVVGDDALDGRIQERCREYALADYVTFHGFLPHEKVRPLVEDAHLLLVSSLHEADPIVALEAAVAGVPTVGTAVGHLCDWAPDAAVTVAVGDYVALARETAALLDDEDRRLRLAAAAQQGATREDADWTAARVLAIYDELAGGIKGKAEEVTM